MSNALHVSSFIRFLTVMGLIKSIKMFSWEPKICERLQEKREAELRWVFYRQMIYILSTIAK